MADITGTAGNDILVGTDFEDFIMGLEGADRINGGLGSDDIYGGGGNDSISGSFSDDRLYGGKGNDTLSGNSGSDTLDGGDGKDTYSGGSGGDTIKLGTVTSASGEAADGGSGVDQLEIDYALSSVKLNIAIKDWVSTQTLTGGVQVINVESFRITGSRFDDTLTGGAYADDFAGGNGNDKLSGRGGDDTLYGGNGNDTLNGGAGNDWLSGGSGNDVIEGGSGDDTVSVGSGKDTITDSSGSDRLVLTDLVGNFTAKAPTEITTLANGTTFTGFEHFTIEVWEGPAAQIVTGAGNDVVTIYDIEVEVLDDDSDHASLAGGIVDYTVKTGAGNDLVTTTNTTNDWFDGGAGDDILEAGDGIDTVYGGSGNDMIMLSHDDGDFGDGGSGIDTANIYLDSDEGKIFSVTGTIATISDGVVLKNFEHYRVSFGDYDDVVQSVGSALSVAFDGGRGNDTLIGTAGADILAGGDGDDRLTAGGGDDLIYDSDGTNVISAGDGNDTVYASAPYGSAWPGNYTVNLGTGDDNFYGTAMTGQLNLQGGTGIDFASLDFSRSTTGITFQLASTVTVANLPVTIKSVERIGLIGSSRNDLFTGGDLDDDLRGGKGNDRLNGGAGDDVLYADGSGITGGTDRIFGEAGDDTVYAGIGDRSNGGSGSDMIVLNATEQTKDISFVFATGPVTIDAATSFNAFEKLAYIGGKGRDAVTGGGLDDSLTGNAGNDILRGAGGNDDLRDGAGTDRLYGDTGDDILIRTSTAGKDVFDGGSGIDTLSFEETIFTNANVVVDLLTQSKNNGLALGLTVNNVEIIEGSTFDDDIRGDANANILNGGKSDDVLVGRDGDDTLNGGEGDDWLTGGKGNDKFVFDLSGRGDFGDVVTDFTHGQDKLAIDGSDYNIATADKTVTLVVGADPVATSTKGTFLFESDNGRLWFDADGKGTVADLELVAILQNVKTLSTSDFILV